MISRQDLSKAAHGGWSDLQNNLDGLSALDIPKSQINIAWSDSDDDISSKKGNQDEKRKKKNSSSYFLESPIRWTNTETIIPVLTQKNSPNTDINSDNNHVTNCAKSSSPIVNQSKRSKRRIYYKENELSPIFKSKSKNKRVSKNLLPDALQDSYHSQEIGNVNNLSIVAHGGFQQRNSCRGNLMNDCSKERNGYNFSEQFQQISSKPKNSIEDTITRRTKESDKTKVKGDKLFSKNICENLTKGSTWLKNIQQKTPEKRSKGNDEFSNIHQLDSTKKKLEKNGMASQFVRLLHYWKSDVVMFDHQFYNSTVASHKELFNNDANYSPMIADNVKIPMEDLVENNEKVSKTLRHLKFKAVKSKFKTSLNSFIGRLILDSKRNGDIDNYSSDLIYMIYCGIHDKRGMFPIMAGTEVAIYPPWQELKLHNENIMFIFSSFYKLTPSTQKSITAKPSRLDDHVLKVKPISQDKEKTASVKEFVTVDWNDRRRKSEVTTISDALNLTNVSIDKSVSITLRVIKIKKVRNQKLDSTEGIVNFLIFGQDPSGAFSMVRLHSDASDPDEESKLKSYIESTRTFGGLFNSKRITDVEMPSLFTVIRSLHRCYVEAITNSESLSALLGKDLKREDPTFIYVFHTSSKLLKQDFIAVEGHSIVLPHWTIEEASRQPSNQRGSISVDVVHFYKDIIYVVCKCPKMRGLSKLYVTKNCQLPRWLTCDGIIQMSTTIEDVLLLNGQIIVDQYSVIPELGEDFNIRYYELLELLPKYSLLSHVVNDICTVQGKIAAINKETAFTWLECQKCNSSDVVAVSTNEWPCHNCHSISHSVTKYFLEIYLQCDQPHDDARICVKLHQKTIHKLLKFTHGDQQITSEKLIGVAIGPLIIVVDNVCPTCITLTEMPY